MNFPFHRRGDKFLTNCEQQHRIDVFSDLHGNVIIDETLQNQTLVQLVYVSKLKNRSKLDANVFKDIEAISTKNNYLRNITGILCYGHGYFYQCVEGPYEHINDLLDSLCHDKRHKHMRIYSLEPIKRRRYQGWQMQPVVLELWQAKPEHKLYLRSLNEFLPFKPLTWQPKQWLLFNEKIQYFDSLENRQTKPDMSAANFINFVASKAAPHQAFILVQIFLIVLAVVSLTAYASF